jgi:hypothetical protein
MVNYGLRSWRLSSMAREINLHRLRYSHTVELGASLSGKARSRAQMSANAEELWRKEFDNPWKGLLPKRETLTLSEIVRTLQWGAPIEVLSPEIISALEAVHRKMEESVEKSNA